MRYSLCCVKGMGYEKREPANQCKFAFYELWMEMNRNKMGDGKAVLETCQEDELRIKKWRINNNFSNLKMLNESARLMKTRKNHKIIDITHAKAYIIRTEVQ